VLGVAVGVEVICDVEQATSEAVINKAIAIIGCFIVDSFELGDYSGAMMSGLTPSASAACDPPERHWSKLTLNPIPMPKAT
jgi:hypothetical protein